MAGRRHCRRRDSRAWPVAQGRGNGFILARDLL